MLFWYRNVFGTNFIFINDDLVGKAIVTTILVANKLHDHKFEEQNKIH